MGCFSEKHLVKYHAHRPDVALCGVGAPVKDLGTHIHGTAHQRLVNLSELSPLLIVLGKSKVSYFVGLVLDENIGRFQVPVDNRVMMQIPVAPDQLLHDYNALRLGQFFSLLEDVF